MTCYYIDSTTSTNSIIKIRNNIHCCFVSKYNTKEIPVTSSILTVLDQEPVNDCLELSQDLLFCIRLQRQLFYSELSLQ